MLKTCIGGTEGSTAKDYQNFAENKIRFANGNGEVGRRGMTGAPALPPHWTAECATNNIKEALSELLPEEIPGLPRHRPGEFSPNRYGHKMASNLEINY